MDSHSSEARGEAVYLDGYGFRYHGQRQWALRDVSLSIRRGEMVVVMGATGAGKTTLAKSLNRTVPAFQGGEVAGSIRIGGRLLHDEGVADLAGVVGLVSQDFESQLFSTHVLQEIAFGMEQLGVPPARMRERIPEALSLVGLEGFEHRDPSTLSGGEKQRLAIAATLAMKPEILVFDEPTTDLDPLGKLEIFRVLARMRAEGHTLVVIEHETAAAEMADRVVLLAEGRVVADDDPARVLADVRLLERHGVRPPDLSRLARKMGWATTPATVEEAAVSPDLVGCRLACPGAVEVASAEVAPLVEMQGVAFSYPGGRDALRDVSLIVRPAEFVALIGQNGSGKTTLAKHLNGLLKPTRGTVRLGGREVGSLSLNEVARDVGYVFQNPDHQIFAESVFEEVAFGPRNLGCPAAEVAERVAEALRAVGLTGSEGEDPFLLGKGQRQRLAVAAVLAMRPRLLVLDEPTTGLDYEEQRRMMALVVALHRTGMAVLMITHSPWVVAEYAQRGVLVHAGAVRFEGPLRDLFAQEELLAEAHFRVPEITRLGNRLGCPVLSVEEFTRAVERGGAA